MDGRYHLIQVEAAPPHHRKLQVVAVSDQQLPMLVAPAPRKCHDVALIAVGCHRLLSFVLVVPTYAVKLQQVVAGSNVRVWVKELHPLRRHKLWLVTLGVCLLCLETVAVLHAGFLPRVRV